MSEKPQEQTAIMHFRRKSSDRMSEKSQEQISVRGRTMAKMALLSEGLGLRLRHFRRKSSDRMSEKSQEQMTVRQDVREVTRTDCSLMARVALVSEEFRQDVREVMKQDCSQIAKTALLSEGFRQDVM